MTARADRHPRWNAGHYLHDEGYIMVNVGVGHPLANSKGYAYRHHLVWAASGRSLPSKSQVLHHVNECKTDDRLDNLRLHSRPHHSVYHARRAARDETGRFAEAGCQS